jgi:hypothetical protein
LSTVGDVVGAITSWEYQPVDEYDLQCGVAAAMTAARIPFTAEHRLGPRDRLDFLVDGHIAVELKVAGTAAQLERQVRRYAADARVDAVIVVTTRSRHAAAADPAGAVPIIVVHLPGVL